MKQTRQANIFCILLIMMLLLPDGAHAQETDAQAAGIASEDAIAELQKKLQEQQLQLDSQKQALSELIKSDSDRANTQQEQIAAQQKLIDDQRKTIQSMQASIDRLSQTDPNQLSEEEIALRSRLQTLEDSITKSQDASSTSFDAKSFPGSIPIPGEAAAIRIGGFVKANMAFNFDTIGSQDSFIVGTIPTGPQEGGDSQVNLTVSQSRLNFDLRDQTNLGMMRAFIEGDFAGDDDTFRLRHAFGQFRYFLIGKTDSAFVDTQAKPEELDFEGINGEINTRQTQIRYFPEIGKHWNLIISLEDPQPEIQNGTGISLIPDMIVSIRRTWFDRWHIKTALLLRKLRASWDDDPDITFALSLFLKTAQIMQKAGD